MYMTLLPDHLLPYNPPQAELSRLGTKTMQQATQLQVSPSGQSSYQPSPTFKTKWGHCVCSYRCHPVGRAPISPSPISKAKQGHCIHSPGMSHVHPRRPFCNSQTRTRRWLIISHASGL